MRLDDEERAMLDGAFGQATQKAMQILAALGEMYGAECMLPISSAQIAGVSFDNLGEAGLSWLDEMAAGGGRARVLTTLNPAGMDIANWQALGISPEFAASQKRVIDAFARMDVLTTCTCTPYLAGNLPHFGEHIAWAESSAVCFANSVIGARTNREGGPSALVAALTGRTPAYGFHLDAPRRPGVTIHVNARVRTTDESGALGKAIGQKLEGLGARPVCYIRGITQTGLEQLKALCASFATYAGAAMFHMEGVTPESASVRPPVWVIEVNQADLDASYQSMCDADPREVDFVSLGCPHLSIREVAHLADLLHGKHITKEFWVTTSRMTKQLADQMGYTDVIEASGARFAVDTCCVVAPIKGRFTALATDSGKACYYASTKNHFKTLLRPFDEVVAEALR